MSSVRLERVMLVQVRFNTEWEKSAGGEYKWRVLVDGHEQLAKSVRIEVPCWTTEDLLADGRRKWHLTAEAGKILDQQGHLRIVSGKS